MNCRICGGVTERAFSHTVLGKYSVGYFYCDTCGFLQTEDPYWIEEAYSSAIAVADTGLVQRNIALSRAASVMLMFLFGAQGKYLDVAGGYGMFTRLMRDIGFDFYWSDRYCENLLARGFEAPANTRFTAVTAFEVLEHLPDPIAFLADALATAGTRTVIFSTELFEGPPPAPESWWYYAFATGQHISFFQRRTLEQIARKLGLRCYSRGSIHLLTDKKLNPAVYSALSHPRVWRTLSWWVQKMLVSRTMADHLDAMRRVG